MRRASFSGALFATIPFEDRNSKTLKSIIAIVFGDIRLVLKVDVT